VTGRLTGRVAIVTGAGHGLGRAYAAHLIGVGARVALFDIDDAAARSVATALGPDAAAFAVDVADPDRVSAAVAAVLTRWGRVDALVNNAGGAMLPTAPFDSFTPKQWALVLDVNLLGPAVCAAAVVPAMRAAGYGKIVNVSSTTASLGRPAGMAPYLAAKAGVVGLTRALAHELGPQHICVNAIAPGYVPVDTPKAVHSPAAAAALRQRMIDEQCLPRTETPQDLCGAVEFLCSADSDFVTGQVINVDGGWAHN
jgi:3-oxoacyl-[acyl-carrier protein] reductase